MNTLSYKTISSNKDTVIQSWFIVDAENQVVGRVASRIAAIVQGKNKAYYSPHVNCGDKVVVINADKIRFTGKKMNEKEYLTYSGYPGGQKSTTPKDLIQRRPEEIIIRAVKGMLPKNKLQKLFLKNMHVYAGTVHPHVAQQPKTLEI